MAPSLSVLLERNSRSTGRPGEAVLCHTRSCAVLTPSVLSDSVIPWTVTHQPPPSMGFSKQEYWSRVPCPPPGDLPNPGIKPRSPALQADSLISEPPGKPKNTGVGSLSLLHQIFPTEELNWGLPHCGQILYQLSHTGSPSTGVGSLSLLQRIFLTQELNQDVLHCRWILYQLSYSYMYIVISLWF